MQFFLGSFALSHTDAGAAEIGIEWKRGTNIGCGKSSPIRRFRGAFARHRVCHPLFVQMVPGMRNLVVSAAVVSTLALAFCVTYLRKDDEGSDSTLLSLKLSHMLVSVRASVECDTNKKRRCCRCRNCYWGICSRGACKCTKPLGTSSARENFNQHVHVFFIVL